jgi:hypothetical protein
MGRFLRMSKVIEAIQHQDTDESALALAAWINSEGGQATALFQNQNDLAPNHSLVRIENSFSQNLVLPGSWVVKMEFGIFYIVQNRDFNILFDPIEPLNDDDPAIEQSTTSKSTEQQGDHI